MSKINVPITVLKKLNKIQIITGNRTAFNIKIILRIYHNKFLSSAEYSASSLFKLFRIHESKQTILFRFCHMTLTLILTLG